MKRPSVALRIWMPLWLAVIHGLTLRAETILAPWGNLLGMRVNGNPVEFEAGVRWVLPDWEGFHAAVKYLQSPRYSRVGKQAEVTSNISGVAFSLGLEETGPGEAAVQVAVTRSNAVPSAGVFFCFDLPPHLFAGGWVEIADGTQAVRTALGPAPPLGTRDYLRARGREIRVSGRRQTLSISVAEPLEIRVRRDGSDRPTSLNDPKVEQRILRPATDGEDSFQVYLQLLSPETAPGERGSARLGLRATAEPDLREAQLALDFDRPGRPFDGIGGNFRLQFPDTDPAVTDFNLRNLRLAWGRVEMPWADWDPEEGQSALAAARAGRLARGVREAMEMARLLAEKGLPVIVSAWYPPRWARAPGPQPAGLRGTALDSAKSGRIIASLTDYLVFLKERYGVEAALFSLNEPEIGVEVRQTPEEHSAMVKEMGAALAGRTLSTRMLLGDTAHGTPSALRFLTPALNDPEARRYIGAVGFHTWRGCTRPALREWAAAAQRLQVPLLVTEGGPDAHLHEYPSVRLEPWFALQQIDLYLRICAFAQPATLMEWQLNTDYSVLTGGGVYGEAGPLRPTRRFWYLQQLGMTPARAPAIPVSTDEREITAAAFGSRADGTLAVHVVNRGGPRRAVLKGLPESFRRLRVRTAGETPGPPLVQQLEVRTGTAAFELPPASYVSVFHED